MSGSVNDPTPTSSLRQPRVKLLANGTEVFGATSVEIISTNYYQASRFNLQAAANANPTTARWWDVDPPLLINVEFATDGQNFQSVFQGEAEKIQWTPTSGDLTADGRDLTARLIETKTQAAYQNKTASEIATILAQEHGLTANVDPTTTLAGVYYNIDHNQVSGEQFSHVTNEWDLLTFLAQHEGYDLYVQGSTLFFKKPGAVENTPYIVRLTAGDRPGTYKAANAENIALERSMTLAKDIQVDVRSWSSRHERGFTKSVRAIGAKNSSPSISANQVGTDTQRYSYVIPNLTEDQALQRANAILKTLSFHERILTFEAPGDLLLNPRSLIRLQGSGSSWDQDYHVDSITLTMDRQQGFVMSVRAKNSSTRSTVASP